MKGLWFVFFFFILFSSHALFADPRAKKEQKEADEDVKELEALIEGKKGVEVKRKPSAALTEKEESGSFYRSFGNNMSIRGDGRFIYIKAGPTSIVVDPEGRLQIEAAENVIIQSKKSVYIGAGEDINLMAGGKINQSQGTKETPGAQMKEEMKEEVISEKGEEKEIKPAEGRSPEVSDEISGTESEKEDVDSESQEKSAPVLPELDDKLDVTPSE